ncbi:MAG: molybdenum cofactor guanylyltransferase [Methanobacterium sp.]|nr:molybdenum cofactor guanylyltransferase [Methanobacterium sp.]
MKSFIILCGGRSKRMGKDKGSLILKGKPMIFHVLDTISDIADEIILVLRDEKQVESYKKLLKNDYGNLNIVTDKNKDRGPLIGILTGLSAIKSDYAQILPCDSPFISQEFVLNMFKAVETNKYDAIVPVWEDGYVEPLHSIYKKTVSDTISKLIEEGKMDVKSLIKNINARYVDTKELDATTQSFQNINTIKDFQNY